ncbi:MAG: Glycosyl transferase group 1 [Candidatus Moranbacteria bacterium GW2011_GWC2_37_73]|nr:MAG: glycosyl transferase [Parcubacteria group bacterium GW2011_GWC1_36_108]KKQ00948.1 MAG: Glycosyl transferase group 1 [Candidatus Moranbacteria bacterium GW2011_GWD1_36_198]KKQ39791.1 MAG: Glycosyl transferase group 1 [Candidatus Moranbacteria bacterium GW2011_GWC2_37_73]HAR99753.1 glycosyltransferase family 4 protein [Candidatus Moranbacteria bacterium]HBI50487.1 glycosyltransferase family 4 protein [Candidatus Moranbacteria bacterium]
MRIAFVHDYLVQYGGAERVLECLTELYPYAPIYTILHNKDAMHGVFEDKRIYTSYLQNFPFARRWHRIFPLLMPPAIEQFDFSAYDVVVSDSSSYAKGIITGPKTLHICYMHTPMRYAWDDCQKYTRDFYFPRLIKKLIPFAMNYIRLWDKVSADRVDVFIANSNFVARRIQKYYRKDSTVIHPPVDTNNFSVQVSDSNEKFFLMVGRLIAYKRHSVAIRAFNEMKLPLKIIGRGPELKRLQKIAGPTIEFLGRVDDEELKKHYSKCQAVIFPQEEDFGIVAIEALACGKPLIAFRGGDIPEHMEEGKMGVFFDKQNKEDIIDAVQRFEKLSFDANYIRSKVLKFDREIFKEKMKKFIEDEVEKHKNN